MIQKGTLESNLLFMGQLTHSSSMHKSEPSCRSKVENHIVRKTELTFKLCGWTLQIPIKNDIYENKESGKVVFLTLQLTIEIWNCCSMLSKKREFRFYGTNVSTLKNAKRAQTHIKKAATNRDHATNSIFESREVIRYVIISIRSQSVRRARQKKISSESLTIETRKRSMRDKNKHLMLRRREKHKVEASEVK